jgi:hypothetical protein
LNEPNCETGTSRESGTNSSLGDTASPTKNTPLDQVSPIGEDPSTIPSDCQEIPSKLLNAPFVESVVARRNILEEDTLMRSILKPTPMLPGAEKTAPANTVPLKFLTSPVLLPTTQRFAKEEYTTVERPVPFNDVISENVTPSDDTTAPVAPTATKCFVTPWSNPHSML